MQLTMYNTYTSFSYEKKVHIEGNGVLEVHPFFLLYIIFLHQRITPTDIFYGYKTYGFFLPFTYLLPTISSALSVFF